jgi:hypothetical protein
MIISCICTQIREVKTQSVCVIWRVLIVVHTDTISVNELKDGLLERKADKLTAICEPIVYRNCGSLDVSQPYKPPRTVTDNHSV